MKKLATAIAVLSTLSVFAQTADQMVIGSLGGSFTGASLDVNYTAGEAIIETKVATVIVTQGFHQPAAQSIFVEETAMNMNILLYPNPTTDILYLEIREVNTFSSTAELSIYDIFGKLVHSEVLQNLDQNGMVQLNVNALTSGQYQSQLIRSDGEVCRIQFMKL